MDKTKYSVLIVEDDPLQLAQLTNAITKFTNDISVALTAERGLITFKGSIMLDKPFDLLITDILLPGMNGKELIREIRAIEKDLKKIHTKIIAMSIDDPKRHILEAYHEGAECYLKKPLTKEKLEEAFAQTGLI